MFNELSEYLFCKETGKSFICSFKYLCNAKQIAWPSADCFLVFKREVIFQLPSLEVGGVGSCFLLCNPSLDHLKRHHT